MTAPTSPPPCAQCGHPKGTHLAADHKPRRNCQSGHGPHGTVCTCKTYIAAGAP